ncbi:hypothetical protein ABT236_34140 [Streptomyces sp. NPDC001523]|uniref:hypothetical protein n=1 Tax=Streptomyces sp. NPDC001523 TaxID=3154383 RepID=UPI003323AB37
MTCTDTDRTPGSTPTSDRPQGSHGCAIAVAALTGLVALGPWALAEFEKGFDGYGRLEQSGPSGHVADPLGPGATAR